MSINGINGPGKVASAMSSNTDTAVSAAAASGNKTSQLNKSPAAEVDAVTNQPLPPRFPWLSRLSHQLEMASKQRAPFAAAPVLGDHLDKSA